MRILVATDFSPHADRALEWASALAARFSAELELVSSVFMVPLPAGPPGYGMPVDYLRGAREAADRRLSELVAGLQKRGVRASYTVLHEDPSSGICARAKESGAGLIALGTRGRSGLAHVLLGSVAERVARLAPCPVLTVHAEVPAPRPLRMVLVPTDFSPSAERALELARELVEPGGVLVLAHSIPPVMGPGEPEMPLPDPRSEAWARDEFGKLAAKLAGVTAELDLRFAAPDAGVLAAAAEHQVDMIVMGTRGRTGLAHVLLGSVAERVIRRASLPVVTARG
jgi:nucleotide-binding universal stress UspA family protein